MNTMTATATETMTVDGFELCLLGWLANAQAIVDQHYSTRFPTLPGEELTLERGRRYVRVVKTSRDGRDVGCSVFCFIDSTNGDVLKAETFRKPARGPRGNIFGTQLGVSAYGGLYR